METTNEQTLIEQSFNDNSEMFFDITGDGEAVLTFHGYKKSISKLTNYIAEKNKEVADLTELNIKAIKAKQIAEFDRKVNNFVVTGKENLIQKLDRQTNEIEELKRLLDKIKDENSIRISIDKEIRDHLKLQPGQTILHSIKVIQQFLHENNELKQLIMRKTECCKEDYVIADIRKILISTENT